MINSAQTHLSHKLFLNEIWSINKIYVEETEVKNS